MRKLVLLYMFLLVCSDSPWNHTTWNDSILLGWNPGVPDGGGDGGGPYIPPRPFIYYGSMPWVMYIRGGGGSDDGRKGTILFFSWV